MFNISENVAFIRNKITEIAPGRKVSFVAVTKTFSPGCIEEALRAGITDIGESKIQEALPKFDVLSNNKVFKDAKKHFIGHLQSNKAKKAVLNFDLIQSLDSIGLAGDINRHAGEINKIQECLIELKISDENTKYGVSASAVNEIFDYCKNSCLNIKIRGIMAIAPYFENKEEVRPYFKSAKDVFSELQNRCGEKTFEILSMGMSGDFDIALQEGANMVRIGSALFGERIYDK